MTSEVWRQPVLTILADDLSGAADCAVAYARRGISTSIALNAERRVQCEVIAIDTDTRHLSPDAAAQICLNVWRAADNGHTRLYKKMDSTLRGNWVSELAALLPTAGMAILAPAMPAMKRSTREGRQYIDDVPVEETEVWRNNQLTGQADMVAMLAREGIEANLLPLYAIRNWSETELHGWLSASQRNGTTVVVCDSETDADLQRLAQVSAELLSIFWAGSAGLAQHLYDVIDASSQSLSISSSTSTMAASHVRVAGPILTVVGSMSRVSQQQIVALCKASPSIRLISVDIHELLTAPTMPNALLAVIHAIDAGQDVVVQLAGAPDPGVNGRALCNRLAGYLSDQLSRVGGVIATGGETARALLSAAGTQQLRILNEVEPGVVLSLTENSLPVITKAGGFGQAESLCNAWCYLQRQRSSSTLSTP